MSNECIHDIYWPSQSVKMFPATYSGNQGNYMNEQNLSSVLSPLKIKNTKRYETDFAITPIEESGQNRFTVAKGQAYINGYMVDIKTEKIVYVTSYSIEGEKSFAERIHYWFQLMRDGNNIIKQPNSDNMFIGIDLHYEWNSGAWNDVKSELIGEGVAEEDVFYLGYTENYDFINAANYSDITGPNIISNSSLTYLTFNDTDIQVNGDFWVNGELHIPSGWFEDTVYNDEVELRDFHPTRYKGWNNLAHDHTITSSSAIDDLDNVCLEDTNIAIGGLAQLGTNIHNNIPIRLTLSGGEEKRTINLNTSIRSNFELYGYPFYEQAMPSEMLLLKKKDETTGTGEDGSYVTYNSPASESGKWTCGYKFLINYKSLIDRTQLFDCDGNVMTFQNTLTATQYDNLRGYNHYSNLQTTKTTTQYAYYYGIQDEQEDHIVVKLDYGNPRYEDTLTSIENWKYDVNKHACISWVEWDKTLRQFATRTTILDSTRVKRSLDKDGNVIWYLWVDNTLWSETSYFSYPEMPVTVKYYSMRQSLRGGDTLLANYQAYDTIFDLITSSVKASIITNSSKWSDHDYRLTKESVIESDDFDGYRQGLADLPESVDPDEEEFMELLSDTERSLYYKSVLLPWSQKARDYFGITDTVPLSDHVKAIKKSEKAKWTDPYSGIELNHSEVATRYQQVVNLYDNENDIKRSTKLDSKGFRIHAPALIEITNDEYGINTNNERWGLTAPNVKTTLGAFKIGYSYKSPNNTRTYGPFGFFDHPDKTLIGEYERDLVVNEYGLDGTGFEHFNMIQPMNKDSYPYAGKTTTKSTTESGEYNRLVITLDPYNQFQSLSPINNFYLNDTHLFANKKTSRSTFVNTFAVPIIELDSNGAISSGGKVIFNKLDGSRGQGLHRKGNSEPAGVLDYNNNAAVELSTYSWKDNDRMIGLSISGNKRLSGEDSISLHSEIPVYSSGTMHTHSSIRPAIQSPDRVIQGEKVQIDYTDNVGRLQNLPAKVGQTIIFSYYDSNGNLAHGSDTVDEYGFFNTGLSGYTQNYYVTVESYITENETTSDVSSNVCDFVMDVDRAYKESPVITTNEVSDKGLEIDEDLIGMWNAGHYLNYQDSAYNFDQKRFRSPHVGVELFHPQTQDTIVELSNPYTYSEWLHSTIPSDDEKLFKKYEQDILKKKSSRFKNNSVPSIIYKNSIKINKGTLLPCWDTSSTAEGKKSAWNKDNTTFIYNLFDVPSDFDCENIHIKVTRKRTDNNFIASRISGELTGMDFDQDNVIYFINCVETLSPDVDDENTGEWSWGKKFAYDASSSSNVIGTNVVDVKKILTNKNYQPQKPTSAGEFEVTLLAEDGLVKPASDKDETIIVYNPFGEKVVFSVDYKNKTVTFNVTQRDVGSGESFTISYKYYKTFHISASLSEIVLRKLKQSIDGNVSIAMALNSDYRIIGDAGAFAFKLVLDPGTFDLYLDITEDSRSDKSKISRGDYHYFNSVDIDNFTSDRILLGQIKYDESRAEGEQFYFESTVPSKPDGTNYSTYDNDTIALIDEVVYGTEEGQTPFPEYLTTDMKIENYYIPLNYAHMKFTMKCLFYTEESGWLTAKFWNKTSVGYDNYAGLCIPKSGYIDVKFDGIDIDIDQSEKPWGFTVKEEDVVRARIYADGSFRFMNTKVIVYVGDDNYSIQLSNNGNSALYLNYTEVIRECQDPETYNSWLGNIFRVSDLNTEKVKVSQAEGITYKKYQSFMIPNNTINRYQLVMDFYNCEHDLYTNAILNNIEFDIEATYDGDDELRIKRNNLASCGDYFNIVPSDEALNCDTSSAPGILIGVNVATNDEAYYDLTSETITLSDCRYRNFALIHAGGSDPRGTYREANELFKETLGDNLNLYKGNYDVYSNEDIAIIRTRIYNCFTDWKSGLTTAMAVKEVVAVLYAEVSTSGKTPVETVVGKITLTKGVDYEALAYGSGATRYLDVVVALTNSKNTPGVKWEPSETFLKNHLGLPDRFDEWWLPGGYTFPLTVGECLIRATDSDEPSTDWKFKDYFKNYKITKISFCINCSAKPFDLTK